MPETTPKASAAIFDPVAEEVHPVPGLVPVPAWIAWRRLLAFDHTPVPLNPGYWREVNGEGTWSLMGVLEKRGME